MTNNENKLSLWTFAFLWCGAAISVAEILTGGMFAPLGFKVGTFAIILGHLIGTVILVMGGIIGTREGTPSITSTKISVGGYGANLYALLNIVQLVGWTAVMLRTAADSLNYISKQLWSFDSSMLWILVVGVLTVIWLAFGMTGFKKVNTAAVVLLFLLTLVLGFVIFRNKDLLTTAATNTISFGGALELAVVMPISWLPLIADYTRFAKTEKAGVVGSFVGYFFASSWMFIIGLGATIVSKNPDPSAMLLAANLGITAFVIVVLSTVTTTFMDVYSAGVSFLNIMPKAKEKYTGIIMAVLGIAVALVFSIDNYTTFLYYIGSVFAPMFAILMTDYFIIKENNKIDDKLKLNVGAIIVWALGICSYYLFIHIDFILGATAPSMIFTVIIYLIFRRYIKKWKIIKK